MRCHIGPLRILFPATMSLQCLTVFVVLLCFSGSLLALPVGSEEPNVINLPLQEGGHALDAKSIDPSSKSDPDAIFFPDEVTRDSYGNPVTPFHGLVDQAVNRIDKISTTSRPLEDRGSFNGTTSTQDRNGVSFVIPSYANGITKVETLFPNAPTFPLVPPVKGSAKEGAENHSNVPTAPQLFNEILPPYKDDDHRVNYPKIEVNTQATLFFPDPSFINQINKQENVPQSPPVPPPTAAQPVPLPPQQLPQQPPQHHNQQPQHAPHPPPQRPQSPQNRESDIYRGGFGGAPGILGEPQPLGWAYTQKNKPPPPGVPTNHHTQHHHQHQPNVPVTAQIPVREPVKPTIQQNGLVLDLLPPLSSVPEAPPLPPQQVPPVSDVSLPSSQSSRPQPMSPPLPPPVPQQQKPQHAFSSDIYTGGFGGAPGVLRPYDNTRGGVTGRR